MENSKRVPIFKLTNFNPDFSGVLNLNNFNQIFPRILNKTYPATGTQFPVGSDGTRDGHDARYRDALGADADVTGGAFCAVRNHGDGGVLVRCQGVRLTLY